MHFSRLIIATLLAILLSTSVGTAQSKPSDDVAALRKEIESMDRRIKELETQLKESRRTPTATDAPRGPDRELLATIKLPDNPTFEDIQSYVAEIAQASMEQQMFSPTDPQVAMLAKVGEKNLPALIEAGRSQSPYYVVEAIKRIATDQSKQLIIDSLIDLPDLAQIVVARKWTADAREQLLNALSNQSGYVSPSVFMAVASFRDPLTYPALKDAFIMSAGKVMAYQYLRTLPDFDLAETVGQAWDVTKAAGGHEWERLGVCMLAAEHGRADALEELIITALKPNSLMDMHFRMRLARILPTGITIEKSSDWIEQHRASIKWDAAARRFTS